jgi:hypothetical protein
MTTFDAIVRRAMWWLVPLAIGAAILAWETDFGRALHRVPAPLPAVEPKPVVPALLPEYALAGGLAAHKETVDRTLFTPTRRPAPSLAADGAKPKMQRGQFALSGTMIADGKSTAILREVSGGKSRRVAQGETVNGMLVAEVKPDRVKLSLGDESEDIVLKVSTNPRPTPQPAVAATASAVGAAPTAPLVPAAPPVVPAPVIGAPAAGGSAEIAQTLAERRRAARAAQAQAAEAAAQAAASAPQPPASAVPPMVAPTQGTPRR